MKERLSRLLTVKSIVTIIVVHYTAGDGDTARNNGNYFHNNKGLRVCALLCG